MAEWRDCPEWDKEHIETVYRLVTAKRQGCIVYPGDWSARTLDYMEALESAMFDYERWSLSDEGRKYGV